MVDVADFVNTLNIRADRAGNLFESLFFAHAVKAGVPTYSLRRTGYHKDVKDMIYPWIKTQGLTLVEKTVPSTPAKSSRTMEYYGSKNICLYLDCNSASEHIEVFASSLREDILISLREVLAPLESRDQTPGVLNVLVREASGYELRRGAVVGVPLTRVNYAEDALAKYDHIVKQYSSATPQGRLSILHGPPGTGKTFLVRGIIQEVPATFILVQAELISHMDTPEFTPLMLELYEAEKGPFIFVIEDADDCLVPRGSDNMSGVRAMLNYSDGLLGAALDVRIIATTNAKNTDIDSALLRPGRLLTHMSVDKVAASKAQEIYANLVDGDKKFNQPMTLAEIYAQAKADGWVPTDTKASRPNDDIEYSIDAIHRNIVGKSIGF